MSPENCCCDIGIGGLAQKRDIGIGGKGDSLPSYMVRSCCGSLTWTIDVTACWHSIQIQHTLQPTTVEWGPEQAPRTPETSCWDATLVRFLVLHLLHGGQWGSWDKQLARWCMTSASKRYAITSMIRQSCSPCSLSSCRWGTWWTFLMSEASVGQSCYRAKLCFAIDHKFKLSSSYTLERIEG